MSERQIALGAVAAIVYAALQLILRPMFIAAWPSGMEFGLSAVLAKAFLGATFLLIAHVPAFIAGYMAASSPIRVGVMAGVIGQLLVSFGNHMPFLQYQLDSGSLLVVCSEYVETLPNALVVCVMSACAGAYFAMKRTSNNSLKGTP